MVFKECTVNIFWNKPCDSIDGNYYIPSIINDKSEYYQNIYVNYLNEIINKYEFWVCDINYFHLTDFACMTGAFNSPNEIINSIKLICFHDIIEKMNISQINLIGKIEISICKILKNYCNKRNIILKTSYSSENKKFHPIIFATLNDLFKVFLNSTFSKKTYSKTKTIFINYSNKESPINYWGNLKKTIGGDIFDINID